MASQWVKLEQNLALTLENLCVPLQHKYSLKRKTEFDERMTNKKRLSEEGLESSGGQLSTI